MTITWTHKSQNCAKLSDMFEISQILPLNHCKYYENCFEGHWTYFKGNKKSQIDFVLTDKKGRRNVTSYEIVKARWHISDHLPIDMTINIPYDINIMEILIRSKSLNEEYSSRCDAKIIKCFKQKFDENESTKQLLIHENTIMVECQNTESADEILDITYIKILILFYKKTVTEVIKIRMW